MNAKEKVEGTYMDTHPEIAAFRSKLYDREQRTSFKPGTVLFYRLDTWHRGTPVKEGKQRIVHNLVFKKCGCDWINSWNTGAARYMYVFCLSQSIYYCLLACILCHHLARI
jgi:hypothetical protein